MADTTIPPQDTAVKSEESTGASSSHVPVPSIVQPNVPVDPGGIITIRITWMLSNTFLTCAIKE